MLLIRSQIYNFLMYLSIAIIGIGGMPYAMISRDHSYRVIKLACRVNRWLIEKICGITTEFRGQAPDEDAVICAKHMNFYDVMMLALALPAPRFIMKDQLKYVPVLGFYARRIGAPAVKRGQGGRAVRKMVEDLRHAEGGIGQVVIYPQGTRVLPGATRPYKVGAGVIYQTFGLPCYPVATNGGVMWARKSPYRYKGNMVFEFLPPIEAGLGIDEFMHQMANTIETHSNELMKEAGWCEFEPSSPDLLVPRKSKREDK